MKRWKDVRFPTDGNGAPTGIALTVLALEEFAIVKMQDPVANTVVYDDLASLERLLPRILARFSTTWTSEDGLHERLKVTLPVLPQNDLLARMTANQMATLKRELEDLLEAVRDAAKDIDEHSACKAMWKKLGDDFPCRTRARPQNAALVRSPRGGECPLIPMPSRETQRAPARAALSAGGLLENARVLADAELGASWASRRAIVAAAEGDVTCAGGVVRLRVGLCRRFPAVLPRIFVHPPRRAREDSARRTRRVRLLPRGRGSHHRPRRPRECPGLLHRARDGRARRREFGHGEDGPAPRVRSVLARPASRGRS